MLCNKTAFNPVQTWLSGFAAMCRSTTTVGTASKNPRLPLLAWLAITSLCWHCIVDGKWGAVCWMFSGKCGMPHLPLNIQQTAPHFPSTIQCQHNEVIANHARSGRRGFLEAVPTVVVERHIAAKPESQVWTGLNAVLLQSITQKSLEHRIACNCGAFAPYFFYFGLLLP